jgi:diguanylate cyclase (GGDEF)-like protein
MLEQQSFLNLQTQINNVHYSVIIIMVDFFLLILAWAFTFRSIFLWKKELEQIIISQMEYKKEIENARHFLHEMLVINKMNDTLQTCQQLEEAYPIINLTAEELFPDLSGGLSMRHTNTHEMETVEQWGNFKIQKKLYTLYDCWGLRDSNVYVVNDPKKNLSCHHFELDATFGYICIPLILQDGIIGLFVLNASSGKHITDYQQQLAITFSEVLKLSLGNIKLREKLNAEALHDPLTGLFNRRYLDEILPRELQHVLSTHGKLCVAMLDVDNFKLINDTNGHEAGDETLRFLGKVLRENLRKEDITCRYGGEEFIIVLVDADLEKGVHQLERLIKIIRESHLYVQNQLLPKITLSIGIAEAPTHGQTPESLISMADEALYHAKLAGRDRIEVFRKKNEL